MTLNRAADALPGDLRQPGGDRSSEARITLVVPTYKRPDLLTDCLKAIARQTYTDFVVHVCDNSPEQEARAVVEELDDARFKYMPRTQNIGMLNNVLQGFRDARTEYVMEVDDDDILYPRCLEILLDPFLEHPELTIVFADLDVIDGQGEILSLQRRVRYLPSLRFLSEGIKQPFTGLAAHGYVFLMASILRRDSVDWDGVPQSATTAYDRYLTLAASRHNAAGYFLPDAVMAYRIHDRSDGLRFTTKCLGGALDVLTAEASSATGAARKTIQTEIVRTRLRLARSHRDAGNRKGMRSELRGLATPMGIRILLFMAVRQYVPQQARLAVNVILDRARKTNHREYAPGAPD